MIIIDPYYAMWFVFGLTVFAIFAFVREKWSIEVTSLAILTALLIFGQVFELSGASGTEKLSPHALLAGFAHPALIAVLALMVMGQGIVQTGALEPVARVLVAKNKAMAWVSITIVLVFVMITSAFLNNTPLVIIAIPLMQVLAKEAGISTSRLMIPLSYVGILGGMTTLIGSSTNLLVDSAMHELGQPSLGFFDFFVPAAILAGIGFAYVLFVAPFLLVDRASFKQDFVGSDKEFVAEIDVFEDSKLIGKECVDGEFEGLPDAKIKLIHREGHIILPPFEGYKIQKGDTLIAAASRDTLAAMLSHHPGYLLDEKETALLEDSEEGKPSDTSPAEAHVLAEIMITPASRLIDMAIDAAGLGRQFGIIVLGVQRRARVVRRRIGRVRLEAGDTLLVAGKQGAINSIRNNPNFIVLSGSKRDLPIAGKAKLSAFIFVSAIVMAAVGWITIPVAAITGAGAMIATNCLNIRQAARAIDRKIFLLVGSMLALGVALQATGGAAYIAHSILSLPFVQGEFITACLLFGLVALGTNVLSNNACAILFTPIAVNLAQSLAEQTGADPANLVFIFAVTVILGANCSFASPIGYKTNLLVMAPGHYRFRDFMRVGVPLMFILWVGYVALAKFYFGL